MLPAQFPFTGYTPDDSGGTTFHKPDGTTLYAYGSEADRIKGMLDRYPVEDQRTAQNDAGTNDMLNPDGSLKPPGYGNDQRTAMAADPSPVQVGEQPDINAPIPGMEQPKEPVRQGRTVVEHVRDPVPETGNEPIPPPPSDTSKLPMMAGGEAAPGAAPPRPTMELPPVDPYVHRAAVDPKKLAAQAFAVPVQQSMAEEGGIQDPEQAAALKDIYAKREVAEQRLSEVQESAAHQAYLDSQARELAAANAIQQAKEDAIAAKAQDSVLNEEHLKRVGIADQELDRQAKREVDQFRVFRGKPGAQIGALLFAVMGGIGQALQQSQRNQALDTIDRVIQNDINAQSDEIQSGRSKANNDLARIRDQYNLDHDDAKNVLKLIYTRQADAEAQQKAAQIGTPQALAQYAAIQPEFLKKQAEREEALYAALHGKVKMVTESRMMQPTAGGRAMKTPAQILHERAQMAEDQKKISQAEGVVANGGAPLKPTGPNDGPKEGEITPNLSRAAVATDNALASLYKLKERLTKDGMTGRALSSVAHLGGDSDYMAEVNHASQAIASAEANGLAPDVRRVEELESHKLGSNNNVQAMTHIDALIDQMLDKRKTIRNISAKTAKIGTIAAPSEGGGEQ